MTLKKKNKKKRRSWLYRSNTISGKPSIHIVAREVKNPTFLGANQLAIYKCDCIRIWTQDKQGQILQAVREWIKLGAFGLQFQNSNRSATLSPIDSWNSQLYRLEHFELVARQILIQVSATVTACLNRHRISGNIGKYHGMNFCRQNSSSGIFICPSHSRMKSEKNRLDLCLIMVVPK